MGYINRRVGFYKLNVASKKGDIQISNSRTKQIFKGIYDKIKTCFKEEGYNIRSKILVPGEENQVTIDIISFDKNIAFCRMGRTKDINSIQKRNFKTLVTKKIDVNDDEYIEMFSYFLMDFDTGIISHMFSRSAPNIKNFEYFFEGKKINSKTGAIELTAEIIPIPNDDAINMMNKITHFRGLEAKFTMPTYELLKKLGFEKRQKDYLKIANLKSQTVTLIITGGDESIRQDNYKELQEGMLEVYNLSGRELETQKLVLKANFDNNRVEAINLLDEYFTRQITIQQEPKKTYIPIENIETQIKYIYNDIIDDLKARINQGVV